MSVYDKSIKNVAEIAAKIMGEAKKPLHPNQQKLDVHEPEKDELTKKDFEMLRAGKKAKMKEEVQQIDELKKSTVASYAKKATTDAVHKTQDAEAEAEYGSPSKSYELERKAAKRVAGVHKAIDRLTKEEVELNELSKKTLGKYVKAAAKDAEEAGRDQEYHGHKNDYARGEKRQKGIEKAVDRLTKEEVEALQEMEDMIDALILEYESKGGVYKHKGTYGSTKGAEYGETDYAKENELAKAADKPAKKKYGARQNYVRSTRVNESFTELLEKYTEGGVKALNESLYVAEEADNEQFNAELEVNKKKAEGKAKQPEVAKGAVKAVAITKEETEQIEEREMTEPEMKKREEIVKSMKKGMAGFKQRYGERAKSVMYATATKQAMKD